MNLDSLEAIQHLDRENLYAKINNLPNQLSDAWQTGMKYDLPIRRDFRLVVFTGMGGSGTSADLLAAYLAPICRVPVFVHRGYSLPAWAQGEDVLVVATSYSGGPEETLSAFESGIANGCTQVVISQGGRLVEMASQNGVPVWNVREPGRPRALVGWGFGLGLCLLYRLGLIENPEEDLRTTINEMRTAQTHFALEKTLAENPAKRMAGQMCGRFICIFAAEFLEPVARRWKTQVNESAKAWAQYETIPEGNHNTLEGVKQPEALLGQTMMIFLQSNLYLNQNQKRINISRRMLMLEGLGTDMITQRGSSRLAQMWTALLFGDYIAFYLGICNGVDPSPVEMIAELKQQLEN